MSRQDRQGARTPAALDQKYNFGAVFSQQRQVNTQYGEQLTQQRMTAAEFSAAVNQALEMLFRKITDAEGEIGTLMTDLSTAKQNIQSLQGAMSGALERIGNVETGVSTNAKAISAQSEKIAQLEQRMDNFETAQQTLTESVESLQTQVTQLGERVAALETA